MIWIVPAVDSLWTEVKMPPKKIKEKRGQENVAFVLLYTYSTEKRSASSHVQANCWCQKLRLGIPSVRQWISKITPEIESEVLRVNVRF